MQTNAAVEQNKTLNGRLVREISPVGRAYRSPYGFHVQKSMTMIYLNGQNAYAVMDNQQ